MNESRYLAGMLKVLAVETRIRIIRLLKEHPLCVGALSAKLEVTQGAVSQHLRVLREAGLVSAEKRGYFVHYRLNEKTLGRWKMKMDRLLEPSAETGCACSRKPRG